MDIIFRAPSARRARAGVFGIAALAALAGCAEGPFPGLLREGARPDGAAGASVAAPDLGPVEGADPSPGTAAGAPPSSAVTAEQFDTTSVAERAEAAAAPEPAATEEVLGTTIASLGDPADPGFWAETPLVSAVRPGRLVLEATGMSVQVELRPTGDAPGSGTRVSLPALRVLEAPLTALPELTVIGL